MMLLQTQVPPIISPDSIRTVTETIIERVQTDPDTFMHDLMQSAIRFGIKVLVALLIYLAGAWLIKQLKQLLKRIFIRRKTEATLASFITSFVSISSTILLIIVTVGTLGVDTTSLAALLAAGGMAIGMALSGTVQNFAGGIMLLVFKPFKAGDYIVAQGFSGTVTAVSIVNTKIRTTDNREVVIPNGALSNGTIDNYSAQPLRRVEWIVSVGYGTDADECIELVQKILHADNRILDASTLGAADPLVALSSLNANDISFVARAWVKREDYWDVFWAVNKELYTQLPQHGMGFAYPRMDVTILNQENEG